MYVLRNGKSPKAYVNFADKTFTTYKHGLDTAQRFDSITELLTAVQEQMGEYRDEWPGGGILTENFTIEKITTKKGWLFKSGNGFLNLAAPFGEAWVSAHERASLFSTQRDALNVLQQRVKDFNCAVSHDAELIEVADETTEEVF